MKLPAASDLAKALTVLDGFHAFFHVLMEPKGEHVEKYKQVVDDTIVWAKTFDDPVELLFDVFGNLVPLLCAYELRSNVYHGDVFYEILQLLERAMNEQN